MSKNNLNNKITIERTRVHQKESNISVSDNKNTIKLWPFCGVMNPSIEMSLDHQIPVLKTQMSGDRAGSQCGLTSLLPMSCRGRAAAFARDLHSRLRNLGVNHDDDGESSWLARDSQTLRANSTSPRDADTFYDFELECESPSSPVDEFDAPFPDRSPTDDKEPPFYDIESDSDLKEQASKLTKVKENKPRSNGFRFSSTFYTDHSPIKVQPAPKQNGHADKPLFSPITFEGCARKNCQDEVDFVPRPSPADEERLTLQTFDSDSEFESAKSEPSDCTDEGFEFESKNLNNEDCLENVSLTENEIPENVVFCEVELTEKQIETDEILEFPIESVVAEASNKELSPDQEVEVALLNVDTKDDASDEIEEDRPQRVRRCSSLKTGKTPPGTPGRKKIVRFADVLGLDLADVKTFMDEIPVVPKSAYNDLTGCDLLQNSPPVRPVPRFSSLSLVPLFQLPRDVTDKLEKQNVCLESAKVGDGIHMTVCGSVRVRNLDFHKTVHIRHTMDKWRTYTDLQATYAVGSCDGYSDKFHFVLYVPCISSGQRLEIAVRFQCKGQQFWDNNSGANYCFDCLALGAVSYGTPASLGLTVDLYPSFY